MQERVTLKVVPASCDASPTAVVERAIRELKELKSDGQLESGDAVWALLDLESSRDERERARKEKKRAEGSSIRVALSDPCFEVWTLLHFEDTGKRFLNCGKVRERVARRWKKLFGEDFENKARADYSKIINYRHDAASRARKHWENDDPSRTEMYLVIEDIEPSREHAQA